MVGRWISADNQISGVGGDALGYNMFAYCFNNPVNTSDPGGNWPKWATIVVGASLAAVAVIATAVTLGAAAPAAMCTMTAIGAYLGVNTTVTALVASTAVAVTITAASAFAGDAAYTAVTGESVLLNTVFDGNEDAYDTARAVTAMATGGLLEAAARSPGVCFVAGTPVFAACGHIAIEEIKAGDMVWAYDPNTGEKQLKKVAQTFINETCEIIHVYVNGEKIKTTPEHPFFSPVKGWILACELRVGDILLTVNGKCAVVARIQHEILDAPITVYNFEVEEYHTYYIGETSLLVHNDCVLNKKGVKVDVRTSNEHGLPHAHVSGNGPNTTIGLNKLPMKGHPAFSKQQQKIVNKYWKEIENGIMSIFPKR